jgi:iron complex transport system substrate-binding protein
VNVVESGVRHGRPRSRCGRLAVAMLALWPALAMGEQEGTASAGPGTRIISVGAAITETLIALGVGDRLVGIDTTSDAPPAATAIARVGYLRSLGAEGLLSLSPGLVVVSEEAGPPAVLDQVRASGVPCEVIAITAPRADPSSFAFEAASRTIRRLAALVGETERGETLVRTLEEDLASAQRSVAALGDRPAALFVVHPPRAGAPLVAGVGTPADVMLALAGARNVAGEFEGYRPLTPEAAALAAPEVVVVPIGTSAAAGGAVAFLEAAGLGLTPAARVGRVVEVEPWMLSFGPRTGRAVADLAPRLRGPRNVAGSGR